MEKDPETDLKIRQHYEPDIAEKLVGRGWMDFVDDTALDWDDTDEPHRVGAGHFIWAEEIDWDAGTLETECIPDGDERDEHLFWDWEEHLLSEFERAHYTISLGGLCFELEAIEMMLKPRYRCEPLSFCSSQRSEVYWPAS